MLDSTRERSTKVAASRTLQGATASQAQARAPSPRMGARDFAFARGATQYYTGTDTVQNGIIVAADVVQAG
jgi:hypothetical protein